MLYKLYEIIDNHLPAMLRDPSRWDSLIVNRRKPHTYRVFSMVGDLRVCLHRFETCDTHEAFMHPHPWPAAFCLLDGCYDLWLGRSEDRKSKPVEVSKLSLSRQSSYEIVSPLVWHSVVPQWRTYTVMVNDPAWDADVAHESVRRTAGKDLERMPADELQAHLNKFSSLLG